MTKETTIPAHSHADSAFENQSHDNASEATDDSRPSSKQDMDGGSTSVRHWLRRHRRFSSGVSDKGPFVVNPHLGHISESQLSTGSRMRGETPSERCTFDLPPAETVNKCDDDTVTTVIRPKSGMQWECSHCGEQYLYQMIYLNYFQSFSRALVFGRSVQRRDRVSP